VSDLHLEPSRLGDVRVRFRIDGVLVDVMRVPKALRAKLTSRIKIMANINIAEKRLAQDGRMSVSAGGKSVSIRVVTLPTPHGEAVVMRILEESTGLIELAHLGFDPAARAKYDAIYRRPWGAILVTGPTGSGKSTTLYATLAEINDPGRNIVTVEDPIEYQLDGIKQVQLNPKAGMSFPVALRSILRADPDVVLVGEIRDVETARIATEAALTGHLMLSSLHTNTAASAPMRLVDMGIEPFLVTSTVIGVVGQRLARRLCERCKEAYEPSAEEVAESFGDAGLAKGARLYRPIGCLRCSQTGYRGRIAIQEVLPVTDELHPLILGRASAAQVEAAAVAAGMVTMREDGLRKAVDGLTSVHEVFRAIG
jgi:type IV pilus assembly protein PilB